MRDKPAIGRRAFLEKMGVGTLGTVSAASIAECVLADAQEKKEWEQTSDRKIRIGVVGGGFGARFQWHQHPNCIVEAVSDLQPDRRNHLMEVYACEKSYESLEKLILDPKIEAVAVFTDAPSHGRHCVAVMNHDKHCVCAVPAAFTLEDIQKLKETKEKTGLTYMMAESSSYHADLYNMKLIYEHGGFGKIIYSEGEYYHYDVDTAWGWKEWRNALPPMFYSTHSTAYYIGVTQNRYTTVSCLGFRGKADRYSNNSYNNPFSDETALFETSEGGMSRMNIAWGIQGVHGEVGRVFGELGSMNGSTFQAGTGIKTDFGGIADGKATPLVDRRPALPPAVSAGGHGGSSGQITNEFIMAIIEDREPLVHVYEAIAMTAPGIIAHQSALKGGEQLKIPSFDKT
jgi:predicted dehydrogenase